MKMGRKIVVAACLAACDLTYNIQLTEKEYDRLERLIPNITAEGIRFDDCSNVFPALIPFSPQIFKISNGNNPAFSLGLKMKGNQWANVIVETDDDLVEEYKVSGGKLIFIVGTMKDKEVNGRVYKNLRSRGWIIVDIDIEASKNHSNQSKSLKKRVQKKSKKKSTAKKSKKK